MFKWIFYNLHSCYDQLLFFFPFYLFSTAQADSNGTLPRCSEVIKVTLNASILCYKYHWYREFDSEVQLTDFV